MTKIYNYLMTQSDHYTIQKPSQKTKLSNVKLQTKPKIKIV